MDPYVKSFNFLKERNIPANLNFHVTSERNGSILQIEQIMRIYVYADFKYISKYMMGTFFYGYIMHMCIVVDKHKEKG